jgi:hypothetical protein
MTVVVFSSWFTRSNPRTQETILSSEAGREILICVCRTLIVVITISIITSNHLPKYNIVTITIAFIPSPFILYPYYSCRHLHLEHHLVLRQLYWRRDFALLLPRFLRRLRVTLMLRRMRIERTTVSMLRYCFLPCLTFALTIETSLQWDAQ